MINLYKYTDGEKERLKKSLVFIVDTREKKNDHIISFFEKNNLNYNVKALKHGDYSFMIPKNEPLGIIRDIYFDKEIMIERKASLDELVGNFTQGRSRFEEEFAIYNGKKYLLIENSKYEDIIKANYRSKLTPKALLANIHTFNHRYGLNVFFIDGVEYTPMWIYQTLTYYFMNLLR